jgi:hypothetical protein
VGVGTQGDFISLSAADYRSRPGSIPGTSTKKDLVMDDFDMADVLWFYDEDGTIEAEDEEDLLYEDDSA